MANKPVPSQNAVRMGIRLSSVAMMESGNANATIESAQRCTKATTQKIKLESAA
jgi:hypothetical protein